MVQDLEVEVAKRYHPIDCTFCIFSNRSDPGRLTFRCLQSQLAVYAMLTGYPMISMGKFVPLLVFIFHVTGMSP